MKQQSEQTIDVTTIDVVTSKGFAAAPFSQRGGLGKAHELFGEQLPTLLDELNETLAA